MPGFVGAYRTERGERVIDNQYGQPPAGPIPALARYASDVRTHPPVRLDPEHVPAVFVELLRTSAFRGRQPDAIAVMPDHVHILVGVAGDPDPTEMLHEFKNYASRALNRIEPHPKGWWWSEGGSKRHVRNEKGRIAVIRYIRDQEDPYLVWLSGDARALLG